MTDRLQPGTSVDHAARFDAFVRQELDRREVRDVLDAGSGYSFRFPLPAGARIVGLDASAEALARNDRVDARVVGDIQTYPLETESFDLVVCWTVLEHLPKPRAALANMSRALRPDGLLIVSIPNLWSLKGLVTKFTPHRFHVWVYRRVWGFEEAGSSWFGPFRTYLRRDIAPGRLASLAEGSGLERIYASTFAPDPNLPGVLKHLWQASTTLGRTLTLGRWNAAASEHVAVFRKRGTLR